MRNWLVLYKEFEYKELSNFETQILIFLKQLKPEPKNAVFCDEEKVSSTQRVIFSISYLNKQAHSGKGLAAAIYIMY